MGALISNLVMWKNASVLTSLFLLIFFYDTVCGQTLTLSVCLDSAEATMPLLRQQPLMTAALENKIRNFNTAYLPAITANGQVSYQSDVPTLPFSAPGVPEINIPKNQYKAWVEVNQPVYDGGLSGAQKFVETSTNNVNLQSLAVSLHEYRKQVATLYFQVLLADRQQEIVKKVLDLLNEKLGNIQSAFENGVLQQNDVLRIQAESLNQQKRITQLERAHVSGMDVLALLTGIDTHDRTLVMPEAPVSDTEELDQNPELALVATRKQNISATERLLHAQRMPRVNLFGQAGFGLPNPFNFFKDESSVFYVAGLRATWNIFDWNKVTREKQNLGYSATMLDFQKEQKEIELQSRVTQLREEQRTYEELLTKDDQELEIRQQIRKNASNQLSEGVITSTQFLDEVLAEQETGISRNIDEINMYRNAVLIQIEQGTLTK